MDYMDFFYGLLEEKDLKNFLRSGSKMKRVWRKRRAAHHSGDWINSRIPFAHSVQ